MPAQIPTATLKLNESIFFAVAILLQRQKVISPHSGPADNYGKAADSNCRGAARCALGRTSKPCLYKTVRTCAGGLPSAAGGAEGLKTKGKPPLNPLLAQSRHGEKEGKFRE